ncbi:hypothetical protein CAP35_15355 [Chitinophagaceae bacterium IBVUCB1]|nr:hypothetical protein CAP35_15355 [Chitinophagaceae bacterium IBVUCB1]
MKKLLLLIFIILFAQITYGQKIRFTDTSNKWTLLTTYWDLYSVSYDYYIGDTVLKGHTYKKLRNLLVREDTTGAGDKVNIYLDSSDVLLYDFKAKVGDTLLNQRIKGDSILTYITNIDSVFINPYYYKVWTVKQKSGVSVDYIESIGCMSGTERMFKLFKGGASTSIICFSNNNNPINAGQYINANTCKLSVSNSNTEIKQFSIAPHPANQHSVITFPTTIQSGSFTICNILGKVIINKPIQYQSSIAIGELPQSGLYFYSIKDNLHNVSFINKLVYE